MVTFENDLAAAISVTASATDSEAVAPPEFNLVIFDNRTLKLG